MGVFKPCCQRLQGKSGVGCLKSDVKAPQAASDAIRPTPGFTIKKARINPGQASLTGKELFKTEH